MPARFRLPPNRAVWSEQHPLRDHAVVTVRSSAAGGRNACSRPGPPVCRNSTRREVRSVLRVSAPLRRKLACKVSRRCPPRTPWKFPPDGRIGTPPSSLRSRTAERRRQEDEWRHLEQPVAQPAGETERRYQPEQPTEQDERVVERRAGRRFSSNRRTHVLSRVARSEARRAILFDRGVFRRERTVPASTPPNRRGVAGYCFSCCLRSASACSIRRCVSSARWYSASRFPSISFNIGCSISSIALVCSSTARALLRS